MSGGDGRRTAIVAGAIGVVAALVMVLFVPFSADTSFGGKLFFSVVIGALAAYGAWSLMGVPALLAAGFSFLRYGAKRLKPARPAHHQGPLPELSANKQAQVRRMVKAMGTVGVFAPQMPDPAKLYAGMADYPYPVSPFAILSALGEANYYHPDFDPAPCLGNLAFHDNQVEAPSERIADMIRDMERLSAGALVIEGLAVDQQIVDGTREVRSTATMTVNGVPLTIDETHPYKYFPLTLHPALAARMPHNRRFASLWSDSGAFLTVLAPGGVEAMNAAMKLDPSRHETWEWIGPDAPQALA